tara:strand:- start:4829 stop:5584 length:756 start_codon:yes stop_codon:yes gene_type:complete
MASPNSRDTLIDYCKRRLGEPVIEVNVDEDQLEDRVDEAIQYYQEFHSDATFRAYVSHELTASDITNKYITTSSDVHTVTRVFPLISSSSSSGQLFNLRYQMHMSELTDMAQFAGDIAYYEQIQQYLSLLDMTLNGHTMVDFARRQNRIYLHGHIEDLDITAGDYVVYEVYNTINPDSHTSIYNDMWLKEYTGALIKEQWGMNLMKFEGMQLPGGVILNGRQLFDDAQGEIQDLKERIRLEHEMPADFFVG